MVPASVKDNAKAQLKKRVKKDKDAPKKPMSPFFCYQAVRRATLKTEQPTLNNTETIKVSSVCTKTVLGQCHLDCIGVLSFNKQGLSGLVRCCKRWRNTLYPNKRIQDWAQFWIVYVSQWLTFYLVNDSRVAPVEWGGERTPQKIDWSLETTLWCRNEAL